jgi:GNAT superfamily N-acetyltransferase
VETDLRVVEHDDKYLADFADLNLEWIRKYFVVESHDRMQLEQANENILAVGGEIFFILRGEEVVATCAMVPHAPGSYELAKMAVKPSARGLGLGDLLMTTAIAWARRKGASEVMLLSNTVLEPAITLYKKHGFITVHMGPHPDYERCNIEMRLFL